MPLEQLDQLGEIRQRPGQAVDLIDDDHVNLAGPNAGKHILQGRTVERGARERPVIVAGGKKSPALVRLTLYICLAGLALGVERVELEVEVMLGRFSRINRAPEQL